MYYVYVLKSKIDGKCYIGSTNDLRKQFKKHNEELVSSTKGRGPFNLIYYEACLNQQDATHREKYLKTAWGKRYVKQRIKNYLTGQI